MSIGLDRCAGFTLIRRPVVIAGHAIVQSLRRGYYELAVDGPPALRVAAAFNELAQAI